MFNDQSENEFENKSCDRVDSPRQSVTDDIAPRGTENAEFYFRFDLSENIFPTKKPT